MSNGFYRFSVGSFECTSLSDGENRYELEEMFENVPKREVRELLHAKRMPEDHITTPYTYLHVDTGDHQFLFDAGAGRLGATTGLLLESMAEAEVNPGAIDTVIITHAHPDHVGGLYNDDRSPAFPKADYVISKLEWDYWFSDEERDRAGSDRERFFFEFARRQLEPIRLRTRRLDLSLETAELAPGLFVRLAPGHTPGHIVVELASGGEGLVYVADAVLTPIHLEQPSWLPVYDVLPGEAAKTKTCVFDRAADSQWWVVGQHFAPFPSLGHVERRGAGWYWEPIKVPETVEAERRTGSS